MTSAKHRERAREIWDAYIAMEPHGVSVHELHERWRNLIAEALAAAHAEGREEMREEAAKILAQHLPGFGSGKPYTIAELITAIRALPKDTGK